MVDAAIVVVEQTHKKLANWQERGSVGPVDCVIVQAIKEVGGPSFYALLIFAVSFLPVLVLGAEEIWLGRRESEVEFDKTDGYTPGLAASLSWRNR
jgi:Cu/Ag efflux pump CusA